MPTGPIEFEQIVTVGEYDPTLRNARLRRRNDREELETLRARVGGVLAYCDEITAACLTPPPVPPPMWVRRVRALLGQDGA